MAAGEVGMKTAMPFPVRLQSSIFVLHCKTLRLKALHQPVGVKPLVGQRQVVGILSRSWLSVDGFYCLNIDSESKEVLDSFFSM